ASDPPPTEITKESLSEVRKRYQEKADNEGGPQINDQIADPLRPGGKPELGFRFLSAFRIPDAVLFHRTMNNPRSPIWSRSFPSGLEVCTILGSAFAREKLAKENAEVIKEIDKGRSLFERADNIYVRHMQCLAVLLERTEPDSPTFLTT